MFLALLSSFSRRTEFTKFVSEEIATARSRHNSRWRRIPMPVSPRRHEPGLSPLYRVVSYGSAMKVWALLMILSHHLRARGEVSHFGRSAEGVATHGTTSACNARSRKVCIFRAHCGRARQRTGRQVRTEPRRMAVKSNEVHHNRISREAIWNEVPPFETRK